MVMSSTKMRDSLKKFAGWTTLSPWPTDAYSTLVQLPSTKDPHDNRHGGSLAVAAMHHQGVSIYVAIVPR